MTSGDSLSPAKGSLAAGEKGCLDRRLSSFSVLGVSVQAVTFEGMLARLLQARVEKECLAVHFSTAHLSLEARRSEELRSVLSANGALVAPDGMPLVWLGRLRRRQVERVCGPDIMLALMDRGRNQGARHFLFGGAPGVTEQLKARMEERFPGVQIVGTDSPPFREPTVDEDDEHVAHINASGADYVWVGLGAPKQDRWIASHRARLEAPVLLAVGAAFDFHAGARPRAPLWMQRRGLEWAFRLKSDPRRLWRRYTVVNALFAWYAGVELSVDGARLVCGRLRGGSSAQ